MQIFEIYFKPKRSSRKWQKSSLSMKDAEACAKAAQQLRIQEKWDAAIVVDRNFPEIPLFGFYSA